MLKQLFETLKLSSTPQFVRSRFPDALWQVDTTEKVVYLTFDDGPIPGVTEAVLDLLQQYEAKATFFCIGGNVHRHPQIYKKVLAGEHSVGNHTYNHISGWKNGDELYAHNIRRCAELVKSDLFRPPFGQITKSQYQTLKKDYKIIMWSALSWDFDETVTPEQCAQNVLKNIQNGSIIVFHDSKKAEKNCLPALEQVLKELSQKGYKFLPL